ncbi:MAG: 50S ribosomal protein L9 [Sedimentisphaerales bacterium]|jgi:large subunit ribosomal protein L9
MKVLLVSDVRKLGWLGDVVDVTDGYARNYLFPQGLAKAATDNNIKSIAKAKAARAEERQLERKQLEKACQAVSGAEAVIAAAVNELGHLFGSVFRHDIAKNLRDQGFEVADEVVMLHEHIKEVGTYKVKLEFADDLTASVSVVVVPEGIDAETFKAQQKEAAKEAARLAAELEAQEAKAPEPEAKSQPEGEAKPEGESKPEGKSKPKGKAKPEGKSKSAKGETLPKGEPAA